MGCRYYVDLCDTFELKAAIKFRPSRSSDVEFLYRYITLIGTRNARGRFSPVPDPLRCIRVKVRGRLRGESE